MWAPKLSTRRPNDDTRCIQQRVQQLLDNGTNIATKARRSQEEDDRAEHQINAQKLPTRNSTKKGGQTATSNL
jgi:hypothetical protein